MSNARLTEIAEQQQEHLTGFKTVITSDHAYIHDGLGFTGIVDVGTITAAYHIAFTTPEIDKDTIIHWRPSGIQTSADYVKFELREGDTFTSGTAVTPVNRNRNSELESYMQTFVKGATSTPAGTIIQLGGIGTTGASAAEAGGGAEASQELDLKANTNYVFTLTPSGSTSVTCELFWYEEERGYDT